MPSPEELAPWLRSIDQQRWYTNRGPLLRRFERRLERLLQPRTAAPLHLTTFSSASLALELTLTAIGLPPGGKVLLPALTFPATALTVMRAGGAPLLCDVDPARWELTPALAEAALEQCRPAAVMPVAAFGYPLEIDGWERFARRTGIPVIIDAAGAIAGQRPGGHCHLVISLHATKPHGVGEGGVLISADRELVARARSLANFGFVDGVVEMTGTNAKLSEYHAAVGLAQLDRWPRVEARRDALWRAYRHALAPLAPLAALRPAASETPPAVLPLRLAIPNRRAMEGLARRGVESRLWYLPPLHHHPRFADCERIVTGGGTGLAVTESLAGSLLGLPFHSLLNDQQVDSVLGALAEVLEETSLERAS